jgi:hypothetical protein
VLKRPLNGINLRANQHHLRACISSIHNLLSSVEKLVLQVGVDRYEELDIFGWFILVAVLAA